MKDEIKKIKNISLYFKFVYYKKIKIERNKNLSMYLKMLLSVFL